jgi:hypothetical protein
MYKEAFEEHIKTLEASGVDAKEIERHRRMYAEKGWAGLDADDLNWLLSQWDEDHWHFTTYQIAASYARLGNKDQAFSWLNKGVELRSTILWVIDADPSLASLRSDPRYADIKRKMGMGS